MSIIKHFINPENLKLILSVFLFILPFGYLLAQNTSSPISSDEVKSELDKIFGLDQRLISGAFYHGAPSGSVVGHPYYIDEKWKKGSVVMEGIKYNDLLLKFDIASNSVVLNTHNLNNSSTYLSLKKEKISEFNIDSVKFIRYPGEDRFKKIVFAQLCTEGSIDFLLVRDKEMVTTDGGSTDFRYKDSYQNYLRYNGQVIKFKNSKTLYKMFPEFKSAMKEYLSLNNLRTGREDTHNRTMLVDYCNSLLSNSK